VVYRLDQEVRPFQHRSQLAAVADLLISGKPVLRSRTALEASQHTQGDASTDLKAQRRRLLIDLSPPVFEDGLNAALEAEVALLPLNEDQRGAARHVLRARDYALVQGMPGTGKTTLIAELVLLLARHQKRVLLAAYTHSAVDNILLKLLGRGCAFLRLGKRDSVHADVLPYLADELAQQCHSVQALDALYRGAMVVGTTCLGVSHDLLAKNRFDYCIVDEASQITQVSIAPLAHRPFSLSLGIPTPCQAGSRPFFLWACAHMFVYVCVCV
jgi:hypothetical protein